MIQCYQNKLLLILRTVSSTQGAVLVNHLDYGSQVVWWTKRCNGQTCQPLTLRSNTTRAFQGCITHKHIEEKTWIEMVFNWQTKQKWSKSEWLPYLLDAMADIVTRDSSSWARTSWTLPRMKTSFASLWTFTWNSIALQLSTTFRNISWRAASWAASVEIATILHVSWWFKLFPNLTTLHHFALVYFEGENLGTQYSTAARMISLWRMPCLSWWKGIVSTRNVALPKP